MKLVNSSKQSTQSYNPQPKAHQNQECEETESGGESGLARRRSLIKSPNSFREVSLPNMNPYQKLTAEKSPAVATVWMSVNLFVFIIFRALIQQKNGITAATFRFR